MHQRIIIGAAGVLGKTGFSYLKERLWRLLGRVAPPDTVSRARYAVGLVLFTVPIAIGWLGPYLGGLVDGLDEHRIVVAIAGDVLLVTSLLVLGGDFWDKLRALYTWSGREAA